MTNEEVIDEVTKISEAHDRRIVKIGKCNYLIQLDKKTVQEGLDKCQKIWDKMDINVTYRSQVPEDIDKELQVIEDERDILFKNIGKQYFMIDEYMRYLAEDEVKKKELNHDE